MVGDVETGAFEYKSGAPGDDPFSYTLADRTFVYRFVGDWLEHFESVSTFYAVVEVSWHDLNISSVSYIACNT